MELIAFGIVVMGIVVCLINFFKPLDFLNPYDY